MAEDDLLAAASGGIVVGMDDSVGARAALRHAMEEGTRRGVDVLALSIYPSASPWQGQVSVVVDVDESRIVSEVERAAKKVVDDVIAEEHGRGVDTPLVHVGVRTGSPAHVLCQLSQNAQMLVVGDRGRGQLASRLIGSVILGVILNARCPVLVVPTGDRSVPRT